MDYVIGIDLGTSGVKSLLVDEKGGIIASASQSYCPDFSNGGYVEQDPVVWWENTQRVIERLVNENDFAKGKIRALCVSGQMHSSVFIDENGSVIRKAILWNDTRTSEQTKEIYEMAGGVENVLDNAYNLALEGFTLPKILWLRENEPDNFKRVKKVIMPKDYINYMLTGNIFTDYSDAAGTLLFDVRNRKWSEKMLEYTSLSPDILPEAVESSYIVGNVKAELCKRLGLSDDAVVAAGGADNSCAAVGNGVSSQGKAVVSVGTSGTVVGYVNEMNKKADGSIHLFNYSIPESFYAMGCMLSAGESLNWLKRTLFDSISFDELNSLAQQAKAGSGGVVFLPYLFGERSPHNDPNARGMFFGLNSSTRKNELIRAVMEGVGFGLKDLYNAVTDFTQINEVYMTGGGAKSKLWGQIISDILGIKLNILNISEGPSFGAAVIALNAANIYNGFNLECVKIERSIEPSENSEKYQKYYEIYKQLYKANKEMFKILSQSI